MSDVKINKAPCKACGSLRVVREDVGPSSKKPGMRSILVTCYGCQNIRRRYERKPIQAK